MKRVDSSLIPARFLAMIGQLISASLVLGSKDDNIRSSLASSYTSSDYDSKNSEITAAVWLTIVFVGIEIMTTFAGHTLFFPAINTFRTSQQRIRTLPSRSRSRKRARQPADIFAHFLGTMFTCWFILDAWHVSSFWYIWIFFCLAPFLVETAAVVQVWCFNIQW